MKQAIAIATLLSLAACGPSLDPVWKLTGFRVLGIATSPAESEHGDGVTMTLVTADTQTRPVAVVWYLCATPIPPVANGYRGEAMSGGAPDCPEDQLQLATGMQAHFAVPDVTGPVDASGREVFTVFGFACAGGTIAPPAPGASTPSCTGTNAEGWVFTRSLYVHTNASLDLPNQNPAIARVWFGSDDVRVLDPTQPPTVPRCSDNSEHSTCPSYAFKVDFTPESRETYRSTDALTGAVVTRAERLTTGYIVSAGTLDGGFRTDTDMDPQSRMEDRWRAPDVSGPVTVYIYANDPRGGWTWTSRTVNVR